MLTTGSFFDLAESPFRDLFADCAHVWEPLKRLKGYIDARTQPTFRHVCLTEGVPRALFEERTGLPLDVVAEALMAARQRGLLEINDATLRPTERGQRFLNDLLEIFLAH